MIITILMIFSFQTNLKITSTYVISAPEESSNFYFQNKMGLHVITEEDKAIHQVLSLSELGKRYAAFQTGPRLIIYKPDNDINTSIYMGTTLETSFSLPGGTNIVNIKIFQNRYIVLRQFNSKNFNISTYDDNGKLSNSTDLKIATVRSINTNTRGFGAVVGERLIFWIPRSNELIELDEKFQISRMSLGELTEEWSKNMGETFGELIDLKDAGKQQELESYIQSYLGQILSVKPAAILFKPPLLGLCIEGLKLKGYHEHLRGTASDSLDDLDLEMMSWVIWLKDGKTITKDNFAPGIVTGWYRNQGLLLFNPFEENDNLFLID